MVPLPVTRSRPPTGISVHLPVSFFKLCCTPGCGDGVERHLCVYVCACLCICRFWESTTVFLSQKPQLEAVCFRDRGALWDVSALAESCSHFLFTWCLVCVPIVNSSVIIKEYVMAILLESNTSNSFKHLLPPLLLAGMKQVSDESFNRHLWMCYMLQ